VTSILLNDGLVCYGADWSVISTDHAMALTWATQISLCQLSNLLDVGD
jgi:hypothetical protein